MESYQEVLDLQMHLSCAEAHNCLGLTVHLGDDETLKCCFIMKQKVSTLWTHPSCGIACANLGFPLPGTLMVRV